MSNWVALLVISVVLFQKKILEWMKGEDDAKLEEEYKLLKKSVSWTGGKKSPPTLENKRKRKRVEDAGGSSGATSSKNSSDSNDSDQGKRSRKTSPGK